MGRVILLALSFAIGTVAPSAAQSVTPDPAIAAVGFWIGGDVPTGEWLENGSHLAVTVDGYLTPELSLRAEVGLGRLGVERRGFEDDLRPRFASLNAVYKWQTGVLQPYITIGAGLYRFTGVLSGNPALDPVLRSDLIALGLDPTVGGIKQHDNKLTGNAGAGIEYFLAPRSSLAVELRYHAIGHIKVVAPFNASFVSAMVGFKQYF